ncbi:MAG: thiamine pyrophosphate-binding protein [Nitrospinota bacterium]
MGNFTVGQAIVEALKGEGVEAVFGLPGRHVFAIYDALRESPIRHVGVLQETTAAQMADMYGRLTGRPGVCLVTGGPGATNALTALAQAYEAASPVVQLSGTVPRGAPKEVFHGVDRPDFLVRMFRDVTKWAARVESVEGVYRVMRRAFHEARSGRPGPVFVEVPLDVFDLPPASLPRYAPRALRAQQPPGETLQVIASELRRARRPAILAGKGVLRDGAAPLVASLARALRAPVVVARDALGILPANHRWYAGYLCFWSTDPWVKAVLDAADAILVAGLRAESAFWRQLVLQAEAARKLFLGTDVQDHRLEGARVAENCNLSPALGGLLKRVQEGRAGASRWDGAEVCTGRETVRRFLRGDARRSSRRRPRGRIHQGWAVDQIFRVLPQESIVVCDVCIASYWAWKLTPALHPLAFQHSGVWSGMGFAFPGAAAAKMCHPGRPAVAIVGDGGLWMSIADFPTLIRHNLPVVLVVMNDSHYGMVRHFQLAEFGRAYEDRIPTQDFAALAEAMGGLGYRVDSSPGLVPALKEALDSGRPCVLDLKVAHDDPYPDLSALQNRLPSLR